jgi:hypothetical protein
MSPLQFAVKYPDSIVLNETASVRVQISNPGSVSVSEARLILSLPKNVQFAGATPAPLSVTDTKIEFALQDLAPLGTSEVVIQVLPVDKHPISFETELQIVNREKVQIAVQQPVLEIRPVGSSQLIMGEQATIDVEVTNVGDGPARNFKLATTAAKGLLVQPKSELSAGELKPGERRVFQISTSGTAPGQTALRLEAAATAAETRVAEMPFTVIKPELEIEVEGPKTAYIRHQGIYGIRVKNPSDAIIHDVKLELEIPAALKIHTVNREYTSDSNGSKIAWTIPQLAPGGSTDFRWISGCNEVGTFEYGVTLTSRETQAKAIKIATVVDARPDLTMTIRNLTDPVAAGEATEYVIAIENHGNKAAHDVAINVELPQTWVAIAQGDQTFDSPQRSVSFTTKQLDPKAKQEFRFQAGSNKPGEYVVRARLELQGSSLTISAEDSTLVYQSGTQKVSDKTGPAIR